MRIKCLLLAAAIVLSATACGRETAPGVTTEPSAVLEESPSEATLGAVPPITVAPEPETTAPPETVPLPGTPEPENTSFVPVRRYIPDIAVDLKYATGDNFTGSLIYEFREPYLRYGTVKKLLAVQEALRPMGLGLMLWDAFRPVSAQFALWEACPDPVYVANPETGFSSHSRGNTVDLTLVDSFGDVLTMPTGFDDFSSLADRDYSDCPEDAAHNALLLQSLMEEAGFQGYFGEWWHFSDVEPYPVEKVFTPLEERWRYALCEEFITLRPVPDVSSEEILKIPKDDLFRVLASHGDFLLVNYRDVLGYVLERYTQPLD